MRQYLQFDLNWSFVAAPFDVESNLGEEITTPKCIHTSHTSSSAQFYESMVSTPHYLVPSSEDSRLARQAETDGTNDARLARSIGSDNHVQIWSRIHLGVVIGPVKGKVNMMWFQQ